MASLHRVGAQSITPSVYFYNRSGLTVRLSNGAVAAIRCQARTTFVTALISRYCRAPLERTPPLQRLATERSLSQA